MRWRNRRQSTNIEDRRRRPMARKVAGGSLGTIVLVLVGLYFEERDLVRQFGKRYLRYQREVPRLLPWKLPQRSGPLSDMRGARGGKSNRLSS